ncbi:MAG: peptidylprolyl isomerase [Planctomycetia bacterium]
MPSGGDYKADPNPSVAVKPGENPVVEIITNQGKIRVRLFADKAPNTVANFVDLVQKKFYDGIVFHRVIKDFMIQTGDPKGNGTGGRKDKGMAPKFLADEFHPSLRHKGPGILSMANSGPNTGDTQFFITTVPTPWLDNKHAIFGEVISGLDVVHAIERSDTGPNDRPTTTQKMLSIRVIDPDAKPKADAAAPEADAAKPAAVAAPTAPPVPAEAGK